MGEGYFLRMPTRETYGPRNETAVQNATPLSLLSSRSERSERRDLRSLSGAMTSPETPYHRMTRTPVVAALTIPSPQGDGRK